MSNFVDDRNLSVIDNGTNIDLSLINFIIFVIFYNYCYIFDN